MNLRRVVAKSLIGLLLLSTGTAVLGQEAQAEISNWTAPPFWSAGATGGANTATASGREALSRQALVGGATPLPFIALPPCRLVDTRAPLFPAPLGGGFLPAGTVRSYTLVGVCNLPANAQAISLNATVTNPTGPGGS